jgi:hypothetical protein
MQHNINIQTNYFMQEYRVKRHISVQPLDITNVNLSSLEDGVLWAFKNMFDKTDA